MNADGAGQHFDPKPAAAYEFDAVVNPAGANYGRMSISGILGTTISP